MRDRFAVVLRVRRTQEKLAHARVADAERAAATAAELRAQRERAHADRPTQGTDVSPLQLRVLQLQGMATHADLLASAEAQERTRLHRDDVRSAHVEAAVRRKGAERLVEQRRDAVAAVLAGNAQRALDELAVVRWRAR